MNREDKILFIKNDLSKEPLDNFLEVLDTHSSGYVQNELLKLWWQFQQEEYQYGRWNQPYKDPTVVTHIYLDK